MALPFSTITRFLDALSNDQALDKRVAALDSPAVTALPANPRDGQLTVYRAATDVAWLLKYDASITDAYKWRVLAGPPLVSEQTASAVVAATGGVGTGRVSLPNFTAITAPLAGLWDLAWSGSLQPSSSATVTFAARVETLISATLGQPQVQANVRAAAGDTLLPLASGTPYRRTVAAGNAMTLQVSADASISWGVYPTFRLTAMPVRVG